MNEISRAAQQLRDLSETELDILCRRHDVRVLTLFGSAARVGDRPPDRSASDLDIGVIFQPGSRRDLQGLIEDLIDTLGTEQIDVLDAERASETARLRAIADGEPLYQSEAMAYANALMAAEALFMETAWMRRQALESLSP